MFRQDMHRAARTRVFLDSRAGIGERIQLPEEEAHHIFKVLRAGEGDLIEAVSPERRLFLAELRGARDAEVLEELASPVEVRPRLTLYQAVPKGKNMDLVIEKATELGADRIVPLLTEHGEVRPAESKVERWRRIVAAAARQSLQLRVPEVPAPVEFREAVEWMREAGETGVMLHNGERLPVLEAALESAAEAEGVCVFVGPEGGWSEGELDVASGRGIRAAQVGPYRLRAETAGVVAVARAEAALRDLAGARFSGDASW